jgi:hypothetical protein
VNDVFLLFHLKTTSSLAHKNRRKFDILQTLCNEYWHIKGLKTCDTQTQEWVRKF